MKIITSTTKILLFLCFFQVAFAQEKIKLEQKKVLICSDCGFPVSNRAISLPIPEYPKAAKAVNASGSVQVQIVIDENGNVIEAKPTSGHPLLWLASVKSALQAKFKPVLLSGKPIRVTGVIVYNYVSDSPIQIEQAKDKKKTLDILNNEAEIKLGEILIGKAIKLLKPLFPFCNCKFGSSSKTIVEFAVNEKGNVESAAGITGYPLLRASGAIAIRNSKFSVSLFDDRPIKVFGLITYDYFISKGKRKSRIVKYELKLNKSDLYK